MGGRGLERDREGEGWRGRKAEGRGRERDGWSGMKEEGEGEGQGDVRREVGEGGKLGEREREVGREYGRGKEGRGHGGRDGLGEVEGAGGEGEGEGEVGREVMTSLSPSHSGFLVCFFRHYFLPSTEYVCVSHGLRRRTSFATGVSHATNWRRTGGGSLPTSWFTAGFVR